MSTRGMYDRGEPRKLLRDRANGPWTAMEREVFNVVSKHWDRAGAKPLFSRRLLIVHEMLAIFDALAETKPIDFETRS